MQAIAKVQRLPALGEMPIRQLTPHIGPVSFFLSVAYQDQVSLFRQPQGFILDFYFKCLEES